MLCNMVWEKKHVQNETDIIYILCIQFVQIMQECLMYDPEKGLLVEWCCSPVLGDCDVKNLVRFEIRIFYIYIYRKINK
jgi:hypothetical protein